MSLSAPSPTNETYFCSLSCDRYTSLKLEVTSVNNQCRFVTYCKLGLRSSGSHQYGLRFAYIYMNSARTASSEPRARSPLIPLDKLSWILDAAFAIPGTRWRIGVDALLGLIPGVGDTVGAALSTYIIYTGARLGASKRTLLKMVGNVILESIIGLVPIVGDIFDIAWRANMRNVELLRTESRLTVRSERSSQQVAFLLAAGAGIFLVLLLVISLFLVLWLYRLIIG